MAKEPAKLRNPLKNRILGYSPPTIKHKKKEPKETCVYFIRSGGLIKIGITSNLDARLSCLRGSSAQRVELLKSIPGNIQTEKSIHMRFDNLRTHGEWFTETPELIDFIEAQR